MDRRNFIKNISLLSVPFLLPKNLLASNQQNLTKITFLHTNDTHSRLDPNPEGSGDKSGKGGVSKRATLIKRIKKENPNTFIFDAGDAFQGTVYYNLYEGVLEYKALSLMGYNYVTLGNHEFDKGVDKLLNAFQYAKFKIISSNYVSESEEWNKYVKTHDMFECCGVNFGIFGLGTPFKGLVGEDSHKGVTDLDAAETAEKYVKLLKEKGADFIIALSHLGIDDDKPLVKKVDGIDLIIGGHSHTLIKNPLEKDYKTTILQAGSSGIYLGKLDLYFNGNKLMNKEYSLITVQ